MKEYVRKNPGWSKTCSFRYHLTLIVMLLSVVLGAVVVSNTTDWKTTKITITIVGVVLMLAFIYIIKLFWYRNNPEYMPEYRERKRRIGILATLNDLYCVCLDQVLLEQIVDYSLYSSDYATRYFYEYFVNEIGEYIVGRREIFDKTNKTDWLKIYLLCFNNINLQEANIKDTKSRVLNEFRVLIKFLNGRPKLNTYKECIDMLNRTDYGCFFTGEAFSRMIDIMKSIQPLRLDDFRDEAGIGYPEEIANLMKKY